VASNRHIVGALEKMNYKVCTKCKLEKPILEFYKSAYTSSGLSSDCKECRKLHKLKDKEEINKKIRVYYKKYPWKKTLTSIKQRCNNPKFKQFKNYGGRGIKNKFKNADEIKFLWFRDKAYLMKQPSIDRIDNDGDYCIENCQYIELPINRDKNKNKAILQYDLQGKFIKEWDSILEAGKSINTSRVNIISCLKGRSKTASGFTWKYKEKDE